MEVIVWWAIPLVATVLALLWVFVTSRPRPPEDLHESLASYQRFQQAMTPRDQRKPWWRRWGRTQKSGSGRRGDHG